MREFSYRPRWITATAVVSALVVYLSALWYASQRWELPEIGSRAVLLLFLATCSELAAKWVFAELFRIGAARIDYPISRLGSIRAALTGSAVARLIPAGGTFTPTVMAWSVRSEHPRMAGVALRVTLLTYGGLLSMTGGAALWGLTTRRHPLLFAGQVSLGVALLVVGIGILSASPWLSQAINRLPKFIRRHFAATAQGGRLLLREIILVVLRIICEAGVLWWALRALGIDLTPTETMVVYGISAIVGGIPSLPGGLILVEGGLIALLTAHGFALGAVVAPVLIYRVIDYWIPAGLGLLTWAAIAESRTRGVNRPQVP